ncbi:unnamed protein product [Paramecium primaurelia]|uniref:MORN repeat protein n=1 Tax=Paramecium primaurelia TaxID=5886 RepID=A0A8S1N3B6_PARPR|nr:unnamed protein product [Paramecium primaurelia]
MGICRSEPLPGGFQQQEGKPEDVKSGLEENPQQNQNQQQNENLQKNENNENEAAVKIQSSIRGKKAKQELQKKKEELESDKPKDWIEYQQQFIEPPLPTQFKDLVNYKPTNENRILPPYLGPDGSVYNGQWNKGEANGFGQMLKPDGTYLKGLWKYNIFSEGGILYPNGDFFIGNSKYGQRFFANGVIYKGEADYGIPHGQGEETHPNGNKNPAIYRYGQKVEQEISQQNQ